jgi:hypothetical protein
MWLHCLHQHGCIWIAAKFCCKCIYITLLLMFMIKYAFHLLLIHISRFIMAGL